MSDHSATETILCIADDDGVGYQRSLLEKGYTVLAAASAQQGLQIVAGSKVAAVIVDYHMPEVDGHEIAIEIKRLKPNTPIVMVSSDEEVPEHVLKVVDAFVPKHLAPTRLVPVLTRICDEVLAKLAERAKLSG
jgi:CheY-like chemotaxis protein